VAARHGVAVVVTGQGQAGELSLTITIARPDLDTVRLHVAGEIDLATAPQLQAALQATLTEAALATTLQVDLAGVAFLDATGVGVLVHTHHAARRSGLGFSVHNPHGVVLRVLDVLNLTDALRVAPAPRPVSPAISPAPTASAFSADQVDSAPLPPPASLPGQDATA
jgi:anti-anti-sigma factor